MLKKLKKIFSQNIKRVKKNVIANTSEFSLNIIYQITLLPLMIFSWGAEIYGVWIFLLSIPSVLHTFNIDINEGVTQELILNKKKKYKYLNEFYSNSFVCSLFNCSLFFILYSIIYYFFSSNFNVLQNFNNNNINLIISLIGLWFCIELFVKNINSGITISGSLNIITYIDIFFKYIPNLMIAFIGFYTQDLLYASFILILFSITKLIVSTVFLLKLTSLRFYISQINLTKIKLIYFKSKSYYMLNISNITYHAGIKFIIGTFYNPEIITLYHSLNTLFRWSVSKITSIFLLLLNFEYANFFNKKKYSKIKELFNFQLKLIFTILSGYSIFSFFFGEYLFNLWTFNNFDNYKSLLLVIVIENIIFIISNTYLLLIRSINRFFKESVIDFGLSLSVYIIIFLLARHEFSLAFLIYPLIVRSLVLMIIYRNSVKKFFEIYK